nr:phosphomevalonate kinase [Tissierella sp.]
MISSVSPGKLYIAGEYAVVERGHPAIIVGVDLFLKVSLEASDNIGSIKAYDDSPIPFNRKDEKLVLDYRDNRLFYVINSMKVVESLAKEMGKDLKFYNLKVESDLENPEGKKYGLGSSAAVTVSTIKVLCEFYDIKLSNEKIFKLAALVHLNVDSNGSCGDIAASVYGGWIAFKTFDKKWVKAEALESSIGDILEKNWPFLSIKRLTPPKDLNLVIGWTGRPASTTYLVDKVNANRDKMSSFYKEFLKKSKTCVEDMIKGFEDKDTLEIQRGVVRNRNLLMNMGKELDIKIETPILSKLCDIANEHGGYAKSSGAGGGDCGIVLFKGNLDLDKLIFRWKREGITYLPLKVYKRRGVEEDDK